MKITPDSLLKVKRPARYLGNEWNVSKKDFQRASLKFALCFPDLYQIGMSNLGLRILYGLLNEQEGVVCERVFAPDVDMEDLLRSQNIELFSLESQVPLSKFDIIGFSLGYELTYTNVLNILDLSQIPLESTARQAGDYPLIMGGGPCTLNPEPLADFFDLFLIGEAEEALPELISAYLRLRQARPGVRPKKKDIFHVLKDIAGIYIPSFYRVSYNQDLTLKELKPLSQDVPPVIKKRFIKNLDSVYYPVNWLLPYTEIVHDRITLEIMRGCPNRCRFCQARRYYYPYRWRDSERLVDLARELYSSSGYEEISLAGLSVSDYVRIEELLKGLLAVFKKEQVSISLPSMRAKTLVEKLIDLIVEVKKTGLTFAPEAARQELRQKINKNFDTHAFESVIRQAYRLGYRHIKLYFMIGLPSETREDLNAIVDFALNVLRLQQSSSKRSVSLNLSIATMIPKPHTPFQWLGMDGLEEIKEKQQYLKSKIASTQQGRWIRLSFHNRHMSAVECLLSRGDRRLSQVILKAWQKKARFDAWEEHFDFSRWSEALKESNIELDFYLKRRPAPDEIFAWDFIDSGESKQGLFSEFQAGGFK